MKDGLQHWCKSCKKQYYAEHAEYFKQWYAEHRDECIEKMKQYRTEHAEYFKQYRADNADVIKQYRATIEGYARSIRYHNLQADRKYGRIGAEEDPLPTIEEYIELLQQRDYYDGKQYHWTEMGLDRIDNTKPHTLDNVVPCSTKNNKRRQKMNFEEFCAVMNKKE